MADYKRRVKDEQQLRSAELNGKFHWLDGSVTTPINIIPAGTGGTLIGVSLNTNGSTLRLRTGTRVIANIANDAPEQYFPYGVYCENGLIAECGGSLDATVKFD